jgi:hypothetical protein
MLLQSWETSGLKLWVYIKTSIVFNTLKFRRFYFFQIPKLVSTFLWQIHLSIINNHIYVNEHESKIALNIVDTICVVD